MRTTCAVINSPARISLRVKLSSKREAKLSRLFSATAVLAIIYKYIQNKPVFGGGLVKKPERGARCGADRKTEDRCCADRRQNVVRLLRAFLLTTWQSHTIFCPLSSVLCPLTTVACQHFLHRLLDSQVGGVEQTCSRRLLQRSHTTLAVSLIARADILQKGGNVSTTSLFNQAHSFFHQLLMAAFRARFSAFGKKHFQVCIWKNYRPPVAAPRDQSPRP